MNENERNLRIIDAMRARTEEVLTWPPATRSLAWFSYTNGPRTKVLFGKEAEQMLLILTLVGPYYSTNDQRTSTDFYTHTGKKYSVTLGFGDEPIVEEVICNYGQDAD